MYFAPVGQSTLVDVPWVSDVDQEAENPPERAEARIFVRSPPGPPPIPKSRP